MRRHYWFGLLGAFLLNMQTIKADEYVENERDTLKTYSIDGVVVTSSAKETNSLRALPGSVSVLSPQAIAQGQIYALKDIGSFVPNLYIPDYGAKLTSAVYIRGVGARSSGQSVGLYVDNMPYLDKSTFDFELMDIQRIEILRGPQGTLYGRNAMGGIVNIYTLSPLDYQGTRVSVSAGTYGQFKAKASHYGKVGENFGWSAGAYYDRHDGFFCNSYTNKKADQEESAGGKLKLNWRIAPTFTATAAFAYDHTDQGGFPYGQYNHPTGQTAPVMVNDPSSYQRNMFAGNLQLAWQTDHFTLTSTTGYQYLKDNMQMDQDFDTTSIFILNQKQRQNAWSQEVAIKNDSRQRYRWSFGLYGFHSDLSTEGPVTFKSDGVKTILQQVFDQIQAPGMPGSLVVLDEELYIPGSFETPAYGAALFHQSTVDDVLLDGLSLTAGVRLDYEKTRMRYNSSAKLHLGMAMPGRPVIDLSDRYDPSAMDENISQDFWEFLPKVAIRYTLSPGAFTYISVAKGYKSGGYNIQMSADVMQAQMQYDIMKASESMMPHAPQAPAPIEEVAAYKPEKSWNYEWGIRSELTPDAALQGELTLFYTDIRDLQLTRFVESGSGRMLTNAGKARSYGAELSLRWQITHGWSADLNYGFTRATFRDYNDGQEDFKGKSLPYIPRHTLGTNLRYGKMLRNCWVDQVMASAGWNAAGPIHWTERNDIRQNFYGLLNVKAGVRKGIVQVNLWSRNAMDTHYAAFYVESFGKAFMQTGKPFEAGIEIALQF